jgi:hypothetical protein
MSMPPTDYTSNGFETVSERFCWGDRGERQKLQNDAKGTSSIINPGARTTMITPLTIAQRQNDMKNRKRCD